MTLTKNDGNGCYVSCVCSRPVISNYAYHIFYGRENSPSQGTLAHFRQIQSIHCTSFPMMHHLHSFPWEWRYNILRQRSWLQGVLVQILYTHFHIPFLLTLCTSRPDLGGCLVLPLHPEAIHEKTTTPRMPIRPAHSPPPARKRVSQRRRGNMAPGGGRQKLHPL